MKKNKKEPASRTITAEDMRSSIGYRYLGIILLIFAVLGFYFINPWMVNDGRCSVESGVMCHIGTMVCEFLMIAALFSGLMLVIYSYIAILHDTDEYNRYHRRGDY